MVQGTEQERYFTKHLFRAGLQCPTKLYYKAENYPESRQSLPFIRHAVYNKNLLKTLVRSIYPDGKFIKAVSTEKAAEQTRRELTKENTVLFDAVFTHRRMMAKLPIVIKRGEGMTAIHVRTKAFSSRKHRLWNNRGEIHARWRKYLIDFAYQLYLLKQNCPGFSVLPLLVLPDKSGYAQTNELPRLLQPAGRNSKAPEVPAANQQLLVKLDVSKPLAEIQTDPGFAGRHFPQPTFTESLNYLRDVYLEKKKVAPEIGTKCRECEFRLSDSEKEQTPQSGFDECWSEKRQHLNGRASHVFDLIGPGTQKWVEDAVFFQQNIDPAPLPSIEDITGHNGRITEKMRQALQIYQSKGIKVPQEIIRPALGKELRRWQYPLHFLDFEAGNYAVPVRAGRPPYHLVVFQFSCHTLRKDSGWRHHQWIDDFGSEYVNYELVRRLMQVPDITKGTIVQYSNFERNALKVIRSELQEESEFIPDSTWLLQWLGEMIKRNDSTRSRPPYMADLSRQVRNYYYNHNMSNSLSIKDVLQSVMTQSELLKEIYSEPYNSANFDDIIWWRGNSGQAANPYDILQESGGSAVRRGTEAMTLYGKLISGNMGKKEQQGCRQSLLRYCELDTLAMMMIYRHWKHKMNQLY